MTSDSLVRDDRNILNNLDIFKKILLGCSMYIPFSWFKKRFLKSLVHRLEKMSTLVPVLC